MKIPWDRSWLALALLCTFNIGAFVLISAPGTLEWELIDALHINTYKYGVLVSLANWSSLLDVLHGYILDRYLDLLTATWIYSFFVASGCAIYAIGGYVNAYWLLVVGRTVFGLGSNPLFLLLNKHIIHWFGHGKYVNFCNSIVESTIWLGLSFSFLITEAVLHLSTNFVSRDNIFAFTNAAKEIIFTFVTLSSMLTVGYMHKHDLDNEKNIQSAPANNKTKKISSTSSEEIKMKPKLTFKDYVYISPVFWVYSMCLCLFYVCVFTFINMSLLYFKKVFGATSDEASTLSSLITLPCIGAPIYGLLLDKVGHCLTSFTLAILLNLLSVILLGWTECPPLIPVILMGFALIASVSTWAQVQFLVEEHQYMIAFGVLQTGFCGAQAIGSTMGGYVIDVHGYNGFILYLFSINAAAVPVIAIVWILNWRKNNFMNMTSKNRNILRGKYHENESCNVESNKGFENSNKPEKVNTLKKPG